MPAANYGRTVRSGTFLRFRIHPFLLPALAIAGVVILLPVVWLIWTTARFSGASEIASGFLRDPQVLRALIRSLIFGLVTALVSVSIALVLAFLLGSLLPRSRILRVFLLIPYLLPIASQSAAWRVSLDPYLGWTAMLGGFFASTFNQSWLGNPHTALVTIMITTVLLSTGFVTLILLVACERLPTEIHEAAALDGAGKLRTMVSIVLPAIRPVVWVMFAVQFLWGFLVFDQVRVMTNGGPGTSTQVISLLIYEQAFIDRDIQRAAAGTLLVFLMLLPLLFVRLKEPATAFVYTESGGWPSGPPRRLRPRLASFAAGLTVTVWSCLALAPTLAILYGSLIGRENYATGSYVPTLGGFLSNFSHAWAGPAMGTPFWVYFRNSLLVVAIATTLAILVAVLAAFAAGRNSRVRWPSKYFLALLLVPGLLTWIPLFVWGSKMGLISNPVYLAVAYAGMQIPLAVLILTPALCGNPDDLLDSATVDGASEFQLLRHVSIPRAASTIVVTAAFVGISCWNELGLATVLLLSPSTQTIPVGVSMFRGQYSTDVGAEYAALALSMLPIMLALGVWLLVVRIRRRSGFEGATS